MILLKKLKIFLQALNFLLVVFSQISLAMYQAEEEETTHTLKPIKAVIVATEEPSLSSIPNQGLFGLVIQNNGKNTKNLLFHFLTDVLSARQEMLQSLIFDGSDPDETLRRSFGMSFLEPFILLSNIETLGFRGVTLSVHDLKVLAGLIKEESLPFLTSLYLESIGLGRDEGLETVFNALNKSRISRLSLAGLHLKDETLDVLTEVLPKIQITWLDVHGANHGSGFDRLVQSLSKTKVRKFWYSGKDSPRSKKTIEEWEKVRKTNKAFRVK